MLLTSTGDNWRLCSEGVLLFSFSGDQVLGFVDLWAYLGLSSDENTSGPQLFNLQKKQGFGGMCVFDGMPFPLGLQRKQKESHHVWASPVLTHAHVF